jgi:bifunctional UDP-N-acetylglucosamine pyrophosphorylase / glucosamine-1-phosphate N-acetyltransferase
MKEKVTDTVAIILAAGISKRMNTGTPKVLHEVCGRPMLAYVLDACRAIGMGKIFVVIGFSAEQVKKRFADATDIIWVLQSEQKGTGHAVLCCKDLLKDFTGKTFVLCGDGPLIRPQTLQKLLETHNGEVAASLATAILDDPTGYGRIIRDANGNLKGIVEHKDCTAEQLKIKEVNPSYYLFDNQKLFESLGEVKNNNVQKEYYLTDVLGIMLTKGYKVAVVAAVRPEEAMSVNTKDELEKLCQIMKARLDYKKRMSSEKIEYKI